MTDSKNHLIKINLPGGFASAGDLYEILLIAENAGASQIRFGNRQQLYFTINNDSLEDLETEMLRAEINYETDNDLYPNIVSSYVADTIFNQEGWLREGVYKDILDLFDYQPRLKINLVDNQQTFVPFFSGNINFIAADTNNYWFMYIRFPKTGKQYCSPYLIYSDDIPLIAKAAERIILDNKHLFYDQDPVNEHLFFKMLFNQTKATIQPVTEALKLPGFYLPYYEGFNKYNNKYWLGIYRRNELFLIDFLKDVCLLCLKTRVGQLYSTPWKSIIIKGIDPVVRNEWGIILSKYHLNVRHAANELNWQIEDICGEGLELKKELVREFEDADLRTYQLCFAIKTQPKTGLSGSIIIKKDKDDLFDILHTQDFNLNSKDYITYKKCVNRKDLGNQLIDLCHIYHNSLFNENEFSILDAGNIKELPKKQDLIYECKNCKTQYDKDYGDTLNGIAVGTNFLEINDNYCCPVCDSGKEDFAPIEKTMVAL